MSRSARLLDLLQILRTHHRPVSGAALAEATCVSLRTVYRDIVTLQAQGADITGAPGLGYVLNPGFLLPPIMLSSEEIEALVLGARWVRAYTDDRLKQSAMHALAKIAAVLPEDLRRELETSALLVPTKRRKDSPEQDRAALRDAIKAGVKLDICYRDEQAQETTRRVWPVALGYFESLRILVAWCELRGGFRHFRIDRMIEVMPTQEICPRRGEVLLAEWRRENGIVHDF
ncbi:helix-turn-helix transcriptional regulator [Rhizobium sp. 9140]|uniref:helix-turn-helix transcriptional regulator n=1 Tax=Rhizobium sp. 9140 TaxID=1761900 RepID=UPI000799DC0A|nr:YafY family protein [Rhizobium sp. 9140]CZT33195.1 Predicted DNA-binding transcriptional regulator YafY, contains an HTH and WYL domains [Rhizobium sp. 9140]